MTLVDRDERRKAMIELDACVSIKVASGRDRETFSLALTCHFASFFPRVFLKYVFSCS